MANSTFDRYEIRGVLGKGGMATVYRAWDPRFEREVALKVLPLNFMHDEQFLERFRREATLVAALEHPAIVPVYDFGEQSGQPYLVMRYMPGGTLQDRIQSKGRLNIKETADITSRIGEALDWAHSKGVVHRDLKPGNILFDSAGNPYLSDFGIARLTQGGGTLTGTGIIGTPAYMSPEQARGDRDLDGRSDLYALGAIVYEMLTGYQPYSADTPMGLAVKHITDPVPRIRDARPDLPPSSNWVINKAMAKDRTERYVRAAELAKAVSQLSTLPAAQLESTLLEPGIMPTALGAQPAGTAYRPPTPAKPITRLPVKPATLSVPQVVNPTSAPSPSQPLPATSPNRLPMWLGLGCSGVLIIGILAVGLLAWSGLLDVNKFGRKTSELSSAFTATAIQQSTESALSANVSQTLAAVDQQTAQANALSQQITQTMAAADMAVQTKQGEVTALAQTQTAVANATATATVFTPPTRTATQAPTHTPAPVLPTNTSVPPTPTNIPPTDTPIPPTDTLVPPTPTPTSVPLTG
ncbi:MAG TPA: protein kinase, partial [Anaerolineales bacterium]|nr:protein kinase [Anaerolineales bacterium]